MEYVYLILFLFIIFIQSKPIPIYNFINSQNYEIDLNYKYNKGTNLYFFSNDNTTLFILTITPDLSLTISMKLYTNDSMIINTINNGKSLYFGLDLMIDNMDVSVPNYRSDTIICFFNMNSAKCKDYAFRKNDSLYVDNTDGKHLKNNLIPIGVSNTDLMLINENVIYFNSYFSISLIKEYYNSFDNVTMFNYFYYDAQNRRAPVTYFYGLIDDNDEDNSFTIKKEEMYFSNTMDLIDGNGLFGNYLAYSYKLLVLFILYFIY